LVSHSAGPVGGFCFRGPHEALTFSAWFGVHGVFLSVECVGVRRKSSPGFEFFDYLFVVRVGA